MQATRNLRNSLALLVGALATLPVMAGPYDQPYSIIQTDKRRSADPDVLPVLVNRVDDENARSRPNEAVVAPGPHKVTIDLHGRKGFTATQHTFDLTTEPCTRYYVSAKLANQVTQDWEPIVRSTERIGECEKKFALAK